MFSTCSTLNRPTPRGGCLPHPCNPGRDYHQNLPDSNVGRTGWRCWPYLQDNGYAIDLNNNGKYDRGRDGVLVFDHNRDGKFDQSDVSRTNDMMKAAGGDFDFNNDGKVSMAERLQGQMLKEQFKKLDRNGDGRLDTREIQAGGGRVWVDKDRNGDIGCGELHSPYRIPGGLCERNGRRLDHVDPRWGSKTSSNNPWWQRPCCGGIRRPNICIPNVYN
ncbi:MAG: hypothetical protein WC314_16000 [Vulcanimicrobiota bacterium]